MSKKNEKLEQNSQNPINRQVYRLLEEGEIQPEPHTIPLADLEAVDAVTNPTLAEQMLPRINNAEDVLDDIEIQERNRHLGHLISGLEPADQDLINTRWGLQGYEETDPKDIPTILPSYTIQQVRSGLVTAGERLKRHAKKESREQEGRVPIMPGLSSKHYTHDVVRIYKDTEDR